MNPFLNDLTRTLQDVLSRSAAVAVERARSVGALPVRSTRSYRCACGRPVFFGNQRCFSCGRALGFSSAHLTVLALEPKGELWAGLGPNGHGRLFARCANADTAAQCNWLVPAEERNGAGQRPLWCTACRLNRMIPDLSVPANATAWARMETAKRRLVSNLLALGLPVQSRQVGAGGEDPDHGLAFDFLRALPGAPPVLTGHAQGIVTLNIDEADDVLREQARSQLQESYRTVLGHMRHEVGHYYWERLVSRSHWIEPFRRLFGDERQSYTDALQRHYAQGPAADWPQRCVSAYASSHPWEDWAETWAHYLHIVDGLNTALSFGLDAGDVELDIHPFPTDALVQEDPQFLTLINGWVELAGVLNELSRALGEPDFYPFVLSVPAVRKLHLVHRVVHDAQRPR